MNTIKSIRTLLAVTSILTLGACTKTEVPNTSPEPTPPDTSTATETLVPISTSQRHSAGLKAASQIHKDRAATKYSATQARFVCSTDSVVDVLQLLQWGARGNTATQLNTLLTASSDLPKPFATNDSLQGNASILRSTGLWTSDKFSFLEQYQDLLKRYNLGEASTIDWTDQTAALEKINTWVASQTSGQIPSLLQAGDVRPSTTMAITSTLSFKATWQNPFTTSETKPGEFTLFDGTKANASFMTKSGSYAYAETTSSSLLALPFDQGQYQMILALPKEAGASALDAAESDLFDGYATWQSALSKKDLLIRIPRFEITSSIDLATSLQNLGLTDMFDSRAANFSGMTETSGLRVDLLKQQVKVSIDENGAEASAATIATIVPKEMTPGTAEFMLNRPFSFIIVDNEHRVLFSGRITVPNKN